MIRSLRAALSATTIAALVACGGGQDAAPDSPAPAATLSGLAATGAAIPLADVSARCVAGPLITGQTNADGVFTLALTAAHQAPCVLEVVHGSPAARFYSLATAPGRVNITPATDLVVARAFQGQPAGAFAGLDAAVGADLLAGLPAAKAYVLAQLRAITGADYAGDPLTGELRVGDASDQVLDALGLALTRASQTLSALRDGATTGADLAPLLVVPNPPPGVGFFGSGKQAADVAFLDGQTFTGTNCSVAFANGVMTVTDTANSRVASAAFSGDALDRIVPASGRAQIDFLMVDGGVQRIGNTLYPAVGTPSAIGRFQIADYVNPQAMVLEASVNQSDGAGNVVGAACRNINQALTTWVRPTLSSGPLNFLDSYSTDLMQTLGLGTQVPALVGSYTGLATSGSYKKVQLRPSISVVTNVTLAPCTLTVDDRGQALLTVDGVHATTIDLVGRAVLFHGGSILPIGTSTTDTEYVKGYAFGSVAQTLMTWVDGAAYQGPGEINDFQVTALDGSYREEYSCRFK